ncbi:MAG: acyl-CoA dehydrogenase family protein, partial [Desulfobacteraceae bacterium]
MDFDLTKEQLMIRKAVREFARREIIPAATELDEQEE